tara:strand:- start:2238 stop:2486 length:249 start_codon:yes stop_codon:yes gene_type:complete
MSYDIIVDRIWHNDALVLTYIGNHETRLKRVFMGYTVEEAKEMFSNYVRSYIRKRCDKGIHENWYETKYGVACEDCGGEWND